MKSDEEKNFSRPGWLDEFEKTAGRPLRVLHVVNIANNAYSNAKIMREIGIHADVSCADYYHIMGTPEWEEAEIEGDYGDPFFPDWWRVASKYNRPTWFFQGPKKLCQLAIRSQFDSSLDEVEARHNMNLAAQYITFRGSKLSSELGFFKRWWRNIAFFRYLLSVFVNNPSQIGSSLFEFVSSLRIMESGMRVARYTLMLPFILLLNLADWFINLFTNEPRQIRWRIRVMLHQRVQRVQAILGKNISGAFFPTISKFFESLKSKQTSTVIGESHSELFSDKGSVISGVKNLSEGEINGSASGNVNQAKEIAKYLERIKNFKAWTTAHNRWHKETNEVELEKDSSLARALSVGWEDVYKYYDIIQTYATDGIVPMALGSKKYFCFEHGTLRSIPFESNQIGRLTASAYRAACGMIVTNLDTMENLSKLKIPKKRAIYLPHPLDDRRYSNFLAMYNRSKLESGSSVRFFSATRQHWLDSDPNFAKGNDIFLRAFADVVTPSHNAEIKLVDWGRDIEATKELVEKIGIADRITWVSQMKIEELWEEYMKAHAIVDQFIIPAFGRVTFDALFLGRRVISNLDEKKAKQFFSVSPPMMVANDIETASIAIAKILSDPEDENGVGAASRQWAMDFHSSQRILDLQLNAYKSVAMSSKENSVFS